MNVKTKIKNLFYKYQCFTWKRHFLHKLNSKENKKLIKSVNFSAEQISQIQKFYKENYGKRIDIRSHKLYNAVSGKFCIEYFPDYLYFPVLQAKSNKRDYFEVLNDKNLQYQIFGASGLVKIPNTLCRCVNGQYFDNHNNPISIDDMTNIILNFKDDCFIKPTVGSNSGRNCFKIFKNSKNFDSIISILRNEGKNFIVQEVVENQDDLKHINPSSLNTFRVNTFMIDGKVFVGLVALRFSLTDSYLDNAHAGGGFVGVSPGGEISSNCLNEKGLNLISHPLTNFKFKGSHIKNVNKIIETAINLHKYFPYINYLDWDLTLDRNGDVVFVELNTKSGSPWLLQMANGKPVFGSQTKQILNEMRKI